MMRPFQHLLTACVLAAGLFTGTAWAEPVDINRADAATLAKNLMGVGKIKAQAIVEYRERNGAFQNADDLANVKGIAKYTVDINRENIVVESARGAKAKAGRTQ